MKLYVVLNYNAAKPGFRSRHSVGQQSCPSLNFIDAIPLKITQLLMSCCVSVCFVQESL